MKHWMLPVAIVILGAGMTACERETKTVERGGGTTVVTPKETVKEKETVVTQPTPGPTGPAGPAGAPGAKGEPGKSAGDTSTTTKSESTTTETKKD